MIIMIIMTKMIIIVKIAVPPSGHRARPKGGRYPHQVPHMSPGDHHHKYDDHDHDDKNDDDDETMTMVTIILMIIMIILVIIKHLVIIMIWIIMMKFQIIDFVEAFHTQYHTILVTEFLPGKIMMITNDSL